MPIAIALVLIFVLYLIDKHKLWWTALKLTIGLFVLCVLGIGGFIGWEQYQTNREAKRQEAEAAAEQARVSACVSRLERIPVPKDAVASDVPSDIQIACSSDSSATTYEYHRILISPPSAKLRLPPGAVLEDIPTKPVGKLTPYVPPPQPNCDLVACSDWAMVVVADDNVFGVQIRPRCYFDETKDIPCMFASIAKLRKGDRVQILSDKVRSSNGSDIYEVKFQQWTGWVYASNLVPEKGNAQ